MSVFLTLPPHLLEKIQAILAADLGDELDAKLRADLEKAQRDVGSHAATELGSTEGSPLASGDAEVGGHASSAETEEEAGSPKKSSRPPPTIDEDVLIALSRWATSDIGPIILKRKGLDPLDYSLISLLAGTEVYVSPEALARLRAADNPDKPNPFLPAYLSPQPPSLGSEYRALTRNLSTALNILFSIFGSAGAVYAAGVGGAGYTRETSMLLAILAGVVVGIADGVLVWIFSSRVGRGREEGRKLGREMLRGSAAGAGEKKRDQGGGEGDEGAAGAGVPSGATPTTTSKYDARTCPKSQQDRSTELWQQQQEQLFLSMTDLQRKMATEAATSLGQRWLSVIPYTRDLLIPDWDICIALCYRTLEHGNNPLCRHCGDSYHLYHDEICRNRGNYTIFRHKGIRDAIARALRAVPGSEISTEPRIAGSMDRNDIRIGGRAFGAPADIEVKASPWGGRTCAALRHGPRWA